MAVTTKTRTAASIGRDHLDSRRGGRFINARGWRQADFAAAERTPFELFGSDGIVAYTGDFLGPEISDECVALVRAWGAASDGPELVIYHDGVVPTHPCCAPRLGGVTHGNGSRSESWFEHEDHINGPEGWTSRYYLADGTLATENVLVPRVEGFGYRAVPTTIEPAPKGLRRLLRRR